MSKWMSVSVILFVVLLVTPGSFSATVLRIEAEDTADMTSLNRPSHGNGTGTGIVYYGPIENVWDPATNPAPATAMYADSRPGEGWSGDYVAYLNGGDLTFAIPVGFEGGQYKVVVRATAGIYDVGTDTLTPEGHANLFQNGGQLTLTRDNSTLITISSAGNHVDFHTTAFFAQGDSIVINNDWTGGRIDYIEFTPVPEPGAVVLSVVGGLLMLVRRRRV